MNPANLTTKTPTPVSQVDIGNHIEVAGMICVVRNTEKVFFDATKFTLAPLTWPMPVVDQNLTMMFTVTVELSNNWLIDVLS
jgi:hypothetical protein